MGMQVHLQAVQVLATTASIMWTYTLVPLESDISPKVIGNSGVKNGASENGACRDCPTKFPSIIKEHVNEDIIESTSQLICYNVMHSM